MTHSAPIHVKSPDPRRVSGYVFVATPGEVAAMDLAVGPTRPMLPGKRGKRPVPLTECAIPDYHHPSLFDAMSEAALPGADAPGLQAVRREGRNALFRFSPAVTDVLSQLTPDRPEFTLQGIAAITDRVMQFPGVREHYLDSGVSSAALSVRGYALKARATEGDTEVFYWCRYR